MPYARNHTSDAIPRGNSLHPADLCDVNDTVESSDRDLIARYEQARPRRRRAVKLDAKQKLEEVRDDSARLN